jgi:phage/plasmid-associated DNA primase
MLTLKDRISTADAQHVQNFQNNGTATSPISDENSHTSTTTIFSAEPRQFRFAVNTEGRDKNWDYEILAAQYKDKTGNLEDVITHVKAGHALCAGLLGGARRLKENIIGSEWLLLDIDNSAMLLGEDGKPVKDENGKSIKIYRHQLTLNEAIAHPFIQQYCSLIYTTASHSSDWNKFRLIFLLPYYVEGVEVIEEMVKAVMGVFPHDPSCKDASRVFYGSTQAEFPLINPDASLPATWLEKAIFDAKVTKHEKEIARKQAALKAIEMRQVILKQGWDLDTLIQGALSFIPPREPGSGNYEECFQVLAGLVSHYGEIDGLAVAQQWSPSIPGTTWNLEQKVRSLKREGYTIATIFYIAKTYGFKFPETQSKKKSREVEDMKIAAKQINSPLAVISLSGSQEIEAREVPGDSSKKNQISDRAAKKIISEGGADELFDPEFKKSSPSLNAAHLIYEKFHGGIRYETLNKQWYLYEIKQKGVWSPVDKLRIQLLAEDFLPSVGRAVTPKNVEDVLYFLKSKCHVEEMLQNTEIIPFLNGVIHQRTAIFREATQADYLLYTLPYEYKNVDGLSRRELINDCRPIIDWMHEAMGGKPDDFEMVMLMLAWLAAVVRGQTYHHKYLECIGASRSGKGTFLRLAEALVGSQNTVSTTLEKIEKDRFTLASIMNSPLVVVTEADRHSESCTNLKAFTGQDRLTGERKGVQIDPTKGRAARGLFMLASEFRPVMSDMGGIENRRITIPFLYPVSDADQRDLISFDWNGNPQGEFAPFLPALFNLVFSLTNEEIFTYVKTTELSVKRFNKIKAEAVVSTNTLALFLEECCYWDGYSRSPSDGRLDVRVKVGAAIRQPDGSYEGQETLLYAAYRRWAEGAGILRPLGLNRFSNEVLETMNLTLKMPCTRERLSNGSFIFGLGIRGDFCYEPRIVSELFIHNSEMTSKEKIINLSYDEFLPVEPETGQVESTEIKEEWARAIVNPSDDPPVLRKKGALAQATLIETMNNCSPQEIIQSLMVISPKLVKELARELKKLT